MNHLPPNFTSAHSNTAVSNEEIGNDITDRAALTSQTDVSIDQTNADENGIQCYKRVCMSKLGFPCVKAMNKSLGATPTVFQVESKDCVTLLIISSNSVVFMDKLLELHILKLDFLIYTLLSCFARNKGKKIRNAVKAHISALNSYLDDHNLFSLLQTLNLVTCTQIHTPQCL